MIWSRKTWRLIGALVLIAVTAVLWLFYDAASTYRMFAAGAAAPLLHFAAVASTAALAVALVAQMVLQFGFAHLLRREPTGLQRGLTFAALSFAAIAAVLAQLGFDLTTIVTTSAIVTAVVGLSVQPMLTSLLSGLAIDRVVRIGDGVMLNGDAVEVTAMGWRAVIGKRGDGASVVVPYARLADGTLEILPRDRPAMATISLSLPVTAPPDRVREIAMATIGDLPEFEPAMPILLQPLGYDRSKAGAVYLVRFWVRHYSKSGLTQAAALRQLWYALRRERLVQTKTEAVDADMRAAVAGALRAAAPRSHERDQTNEAAAQQLIAAGELLAFGDGERIVLPERCAASACLLVSGACAQCADGGRQAGPQSTSDPPQTRPAVLARIERLLAERIGPYAEYAVAQANRPGRGLAEICDAVALEIDDPAQRAAFVAAVDAPRDTVHGPGLMVQSRRDRAQRLVSVPPLRARGHAVFLAAPPAAFTAARAGSGEK